MKINKKIIQILSFFTIFLTLIIIVDVISSKNTIKNLRINNFTLNYDSSIYIIEFLQDIQNQIYFNNFNFKTGELLLNSLDRKYSINYKFFDKELPPSNALNDFNPIPKNSPYHKIYNLKDRELNMIIFCQNTSLNIQCFPVTEKYNSVYDYGQELKKGNFYFEERLKLVEMGNTKLNITIYSKEFPETEDLLEILQIHKNLLLAKPNN